MRSAVLALGLLACGGSDDPGERPRVFGGDREVELQAPDVLDEGREYPLVLVLHGYGANGLVQTGYFQLADLPENNEALLLAPDGTVDAGGRHFWNADPACCDFGGTGVDDVGYLSSVLEDVLDAWPVDRSQVYVVGHSNGGFMGYRMACERADLITATAILAGNTSQPASACTPSEPTSMLVLHGTADETVPYTGVQPGGGPLQQTSAGAVESHARWSQYDGCGPSEVTGSIDLDKGDGTGTETEVTVATGCPGSIGVELWTHQGVGHLPAYNNAFGSTLWTWLTDHARL